MNLLDSIAGPSNLKTMGLEQLQQLAGEVRDRIIETISHQGGHLAPSLGVVELTVALHSVFSSPADKIIWDVGHQSYAHKLLTGRADRFSTIRSRGGLSGFPRRDESPHDAFGTGHASTSISAALGLAHARDLAGKKHDVVAVVGDGALTGGLAFEGLNNAGNAGTNLIVVLNDNSMSIASNVGALATYLSRLRSDPTYSRLKADLESVLRRVPVIGDQVQRTLERVKDSVKYLVLPGMLFEELGFTYLGPVDGHNIGSLQSGLRSARKVKGPVLIHVITRKGKGYGPAESRPDTFHGTGPFVRETGKPRSGSGLPSYSELFGQALVECARRDPSVVAVTAAMPDGTGLGPFKAEFPDRMFDVGIAEAHAVTFAAGLAAGGLKPVVAIYSTFMQRAYDNVVHDVCLQDLPVVLALDRAGLVGEDGATHHGALDLAYLSSMPNMTVGAPSSGRELRDMLVAALQHGKPVALRYPRHRSEPWKDELESPLTPPGAGVPVPIGDVVLVACGTMVPVAVKAAGLLSGRGVNAGVINMRWVKPLDLDVLLPGARTASLVLTLEEGTVTGGLGSGVRAALASAGIDTVVRCLGLPDGIIEHGTRSELLADIGLTPERIAALTLTYLSHAPARSLLQDREKATLRR